MAIEQKSISDLSAQLRRTFEHGKQILAQGNYAYGCELLRTVLRTEPGCHEVRDVLRKSQLDHVKNEVNSLRMVVAFFQTFWPVMVSGPVQLRKGNFAEALDIAEKAMEKDPTLASSLSFLTKVAEAAGLRPVVLDTINLRLKFYQDDIAALKAAVEMLKKINMYDRALEVQQQICLLNPTNLAEQDAYKRASAEAALRSGWDKADSYRDMIRDKDQAVLLEQQETATVRDIDSLMALIAQAEKDAEAQATAANYKKLADLYRRGKIFDKAVAAYNKLVELTGALDPNIDEAITDSMSGQYDDAITKWCKYGQDNPDKQGEVEAKIVELQAQKQKMLMQRLIGRCERYPQEPRYQFELGSMYWQQRNFDAALRAFQQAQRSPKLRSQAIVYMGKCFAEKGIADLAIEEFTKALDLYPTMDKERKELLYDLGEAWEKKGDHGKALEFFKEIYSDDASYRDVAAKVESTYSQQR